jgi:hypothetical protein
MAPKLSNLKMVCVIETKTWIRAFYTDQDRYSKNSQNLYKAHIFVHNYLFDNLRITIISHALARFNVISNRKQLRMDSVAVESKNAVELKNPVLTYR